MVLKVLEAVSPVLTVLSVLLLRRRREGDDLPLDVRQRLSLLQSDPGHLLLRVPGRQEAHPLVGGGAAQDTPTPSQSERALTHLRSAEADPTRLGGQFGEQQPTTRRSRSMFSKDQLPTLSDLLGVSEVTLPVIISTTSRS